MSVDTNGKTDAAVPTDVSEKPERAPYRPEASTEKLFDRIVGSEYDMAHQAAHQACMFLSLANHYDRDKGHEVRDRHLVDGAECLEIAMTHLGRMRMALAYRQVMSEDLGYEHEDDQDTDG